MKRSYKFYTKTEKLGLRFPSNRPGLGVEINENKLNKQPFEQEIPRRSYRRDGSVVDW